MADRTLLERLASRLRTLRASAEEDLKHRARTSNWDGYRSPATALRRIANDARKAGEEDAAGRIGELADAVRDAAKALPDRDGVEATTSALRNAQAALVAIAATADGLSAPPDGDGATDAAGEPPADATPPPVDATTEIADEEPTDEPAGDGEVGPLPYDTAAAGDDLSVPPGWSRDPGNPKRWNSPPIDDWGDLDYEFVDAIREKGQHINPNSAFGRSVLMPNRRIRKARDAHEGAPAPPGGNATSPGGTLLDATSPFGATSDWSDFGLDGTAHHGVLDFMDRHVGRTETAPPPVLIPQGPVADLEVARILGDHLNVRDDDDPVVRANLGELGLIPAHLLARLRDGGVHIYIGAGAVPTLDDMGHLAGVQPRGWDAGRTWDEVAGVGGPTMIAGSSDTWYIGLTLHEAGHSLGHVTGLDHSDEMRAHHVRLHPKLDPYHAQGGPGGEAGMEETFATGFMTLILFGRDEAIRVYDEAFVDWLELVLAPKPVAYAITPETSLPRFGTVGLEIRDENGAPLPGVTVTIPGAGVRVTDANGRVSFTDVLPGASYVSASIEGFAYQTKPINVNPGIDMSLAITMRPGVPFSPITSDVSPITSDAPPSRLVRLGAGLAATFLGLGAAGAGGATLIGGGGDAANGQAPIIRLVTGPIDFTVDGTPPPGFDFEPNVTGRFDATVKPGEREGLFVFGNFFVNTEVRTTDGRCVFGSTSERTIEGQVDPATGAVSGTVTGTGKLETIAGGPECRRNDTANQQLSPQQLTGAFNLRTGAFEGSATDDNTVIDFTGELSAARLRALIEQVSTGAQEPPGTEVEASGEARFTPQSSQPGRLFTPGIGDVSLVFFLDDDFPGVIGFRGQSTVPGSLVVEGVGEATTESNGKEEGTIDPQTGAVTGTREHTSGATAEPGSPDELTQPEQPVGTEQLSGSVDFDTGKITVEAPASSGVTTIDATADPEELRALRDAALAAAPAEAPSVEATGATKGEVQSSGDAVSTPESLEAVLRFPAAGGDVTGELRSVFRTEFSSFFCVRRDTFVSVLTGTYNPAAGTMRGTSENAAPVVEVVAGCEGTTTEVSPGGTTNWSATVDRTAGVITGESEGDPPHAFEVQVADPGDLAIPEAPPAESSSDAPSGGGSRATGGGGDTPLGVGLVLGGLALAGVGGRTLVRGRRGVLSAADTAKRAAALIRDAADNIESMQGQRVRRRLWRSAVVKPLAEADALLRPVRTSFTPVPTIPDLPPSARDGCNPSAMSSDEGGLTTIAPPPFVLPELRETADQLDAFASTDIDEVIQ